jgi:thymidylate synthase
MQHDLDPMHRVRNEGVRKSDRTGTGTLAVLEQADVHLARTPRALPRMEINPAVCAILDCRFEGCALSGYDVHAHIDAGVAV